jgi:hypothetical protein
MRETPLNKRPLAPQDIRRLPIAFHPVLNAKLKGWAKNCGYKTSFLRAATPKAIRSRHSESRLKRKWQKATGDQPDIHRLNLDAEQRMFIYYTIESSAVVIRGYGFRFEWDTGDDTEEGGLFPDSKWFPDDPAFAHSSEFPLFLSFNR